MQPADRHFPYYLATAENSGLKLVLQLVMQLVMKLGLVVQALIACQREHLFVRHKPGK
jgi:hypothetical protein